MAAEEPGPGCACLHCRGVPRGSDLVEVILAWMDMKATGTARGDAEQLVDALRDAGYALERET